MLMSWLSPQSPVSRCHLWYWPILLNTEHNESEWLWQMSSSSTDHNTAPTPSHTRRSQGSQFPRDSQRPIRQNFEMVDWHIFWRVKPTPVCDVCRLYQGVIAIVKVYSWLSRDNKRRRGVPRLYTGLTDSIMMWLYPPPPLNAQSMPGPGSVTGQFHIKPI